MGSASWHWRRLPRVYPEFTQRLPRDYPEFTQRLRGVYPNSTPENSQRVPRDYPEITQRVPREYPDADANPILASLILLTSIWDALTQVFPPPVRIGGEGGGAFCIS